MCLKHSNPESFSGSGPSQKYIITGENSGMRLDKFLVGKMPEFSRSQIQKMIKNGQVLVNEKQVAVHHFLKEGNQILIKGSMRLEKEKGLKDKRAGLGKLEIIFDDPNFLVVNKPAGLLVHQAPGHQEITLIDLILEKYPEIAKVGEDPSRPGIIHRLDREVSGLMVIAKTQAAFDHLKSQFKQRKVKKEYIALAYGKPAKPEGEIDFNIDRSVKGFKMAAKPDEKGRKALTRFEVVKQFDNFTLLKLMPETGRTHQIRVHLNAYGLPIVGDSIYRSKKAKTKVEINRIFLQANYLGFYDLDNNWKEFNIKLDKELEKILENMKEN